MAEEIPQGDDFTDFVLREFIRLGASIRTLREETTDMLRRAEERLEQVTSVRDALAGSGPASVKLVNRAADGDITSIEEYRG